MTLPIRARLTAWYIALLAIILTALGAFLVVRLRSDLVEGIDRSLDSRVAQISLDYGGEREGEFQDVSDAPLRGVTLEESAAQILSSDGRVLQSSGDSAAESPMVQPPVVSRSLGGRRIRKSVLLGPDRESFRILTLAAPTAQRNDVLVVAESLDGVDRSVDRLLMLLLFAGPAALIAAGLGGWWLARRALLPVARMTRKAAEIGVERLDERVAVPKTSDELERLATTLNAMLQRLQEGVQEKHRLVADASHELRTPLAIMRSELDVSLRSDGLSAEARPVLESALEEIESMSRMVENLLTLSRIDDGRLQLMSKPIDLRKLASTVSRDLQSLARARSVSITSEGVAVMVRGDADRLYLAVTNLVENAVKYAEADGNVQISAWSQDGDACLSVADSGPGIPVEALPYIFDRFFRVDAARSRSEGGAGLGLAICKEIVEAHGGRVSVDTKPGFGSRFSISLPAA